MSVLASRTACRSAIRRAARFILDRSPVNSIAGHGPKATIAASSKTPTSAATILAACALSFLLPATIASADPSISPASSPAITQAQNSDPSAANQQDAGQRGLARWGASPITSAAGLASKLAESPVLRTAPLDIDPAFIANIAESPDSAWPVIGPIEIRALAAADITLSPVRRHDEGLAGITVLQCELLLNGRSHPNAYALLAPAFDQQQNRHVLAGMLFTGDNVGYVIRTNEQGQHIIEEVDASRLPSCGNTEHERIVIEGHAPFDGIGTRGFGDGDRVDVLVAYTPNALSHLGGSTASMATQIATAVTDGNLAYETSQIGLRVFLAGDPLPVAASNPDSSNTALTQLRSFNDGNFDEVHARREQVSADIVVLMTGTNLTDCGRAYLMATPALSFESNAFAVVRIDCIFNRTFVHELGHVMGCEHARPEATGAGSYPYSYGHRNATNSWRTVMALPPGIRLNQFSNPNVLHQGEPTGVPQGATNQADNAQTINLNTYFVANFRSSTPPCPGTTPSNPQALGSLPASVAGSTLGCGLQTGWTCTSAGSTGNAAYLTFSVPGQINARITAVGENFPIRVQLFSSPSIAAAPIACAQANANQSAQIVGIQLNPGTTYMVAVGGQSQGHDGPFTLLVEADCPIDELTARVIPPMTRLTTWSDFGDTSSCGNHFVQRCNDLPNSLLSFGPDVVYRYTPEIDSVLEINTCNNIWNSVVFVHEDQIIPGEALYCDSNHTGCGTGHQARLMNAALKEGRTYYIILDGESVPASPVSGGPYQLNVIDNTPCRGTACTTAVVMDATIPSIKTMDTGCATGTTPISPCNTGVTGTTRNAVWAQWTAPQSGPVVLRVDPTIRVNYHAVAAIYTNTCTNPIHLACGHGSAPFNIPFTAQQGVTYRIQVGTFGSTPNSGVNRFSKLTIKLPTQDCPCDRNNDGLQTIDDYFTYLNEFFTQLNGPGSADLSGDGVVTIEDFFTFLNCIPAIAASQACPSS